MSKIKFYKDSAKTQQVYPELDPEDITKFESLEDIENAFPNVSGEDTSVTLNHTVEAPMKLELAPSELWQKTTTGKNLIDYSLFTATDYVSNVSYTDESITATFIGAYRGSQQFYDLEDGITYTLSVGAITNTIGRIELRFIKDDEIVSSLSKNVTANSNYTFTIDKSLYDTVRIGISNGDLSGTNTITFYKLQLEKSSTATSFEPYTGGLPQPNPDFPSQVHSVSGNNKIIINSKNLCPPKYKNNVNDLVANKDLTNIKIDLDLNSAIGRTYLTIGCYLPAGTYTISNVSDTYISFNRIAIAGTTCISSQYHLRNSYTWTQNVDGYTYFGIEGDAGETSYTDTPIANELKLQIEKNSIATIYEPYQERRFLLNFPVKNLFNINGDVNTRYNGQTGTSNIVNGNDLTASVNTANAHPLGQRIYVGSGKKVTLSATLKSVTYDAEPASTDSVANMILYDDNTITGMQGTFFYYNEIGVRKSITFTSTTDYIYATFGKRTAVTNCTYTDIQVEIGNEAGVYTPYGTTPLEYCKLGSYSDEFFKNDPSDPNYDSSLELDKWYLKKNVGKVVFDENSGISLNVTTNYTQLAMSGALDVPSTTSSGKGISNYFRYSYNNVIGNFYYSSNKYVYMVVSPSITNVTEAKAWLSTHNTDVYYPLATPQYILLNDTLQHQLDDIYNWVESYPGQTNISQINDDLPFIISAHAMRDLSVIDKYPTEDSEHLVESGGVYEVINDLGAVQQEQATQIEALERANLIYNALPKVTGSGTNLTLDNTAESPLALDLSGNTSQVSYSGKNKASSVFTDYRTYDNSYYVMPIELEQGETYVLSATRVGELKTSYYNYGIVKAGNIYTDFVDLKTCVDYANGATDTRILTIDNTFTNPHLVCYLGSSGDREAKFLELITNYQIQFEKSSAKTDYEPYCGGTTSPNPDFPQRVEVVSGDNVVRVSGKNLFNINAPYYQRLNTGTITINGNELTVENTNNNTNQFVWWNIPVGIGKQITISYDNFIESTSNSNNCLTYMFSDTPLKTFSTFEPFYKVDKTNQYVTMSATGKYLIIGLRNIQSDTNSISKIQVEYNSTKTTYEPYIGKDYKIDLPVENLVNTTGLNLTANASGAVAIPGTPSSYLSIDDYVTVKPNTTYTITFEKDVGGKLFASTKDSTGAFIERHDYGSVRTFTTGNNVYQAFLYIYKSDGSYENVGGYVQLEECTHANHYTPYGTTPIELCKIEDYADYFYKNNGKWYLHKVIYKKIFDGTESWGNPKRYDGVTRYYEMGNLSPRPNIGVTGTGRTKGEYFSHFIQNNPYEYVIDCAWIFYNAGSNYSLARMGFKNSFDSTADFKAWLSENPVTAYYPLYEPSNVEITDPILISQLEDISMAISYQTQTNISQINNDLPFNIDATAVLDLNTLINAIVSLGGNI